MNINLSFDEKMRLMKKFSISTIKIFNKIFSLWEKAYSSNKGSSFEEFLNLLYTGSWQKDNSFDFRQKYPSFEDYAIVILERTIDMHENYPQRKCGTQELRSKMHAEQQKKNLSAQDKQKGEGKQK